MKIFLYKKIIFLFLVSFCLFGVVSKTFAATLSKPANNLGLVSYLSFNEATGTVATDFSGNRNTGTLVGMAHPATASSGWGAGKFGSGLNFDGVSDYVSFNGVANDVVETSFAVSLWMRCPASASAGGWGVWAVNEPNYNNNTQIYVDDANVVKLWDGDNEALEITGSIIVCGNSNWHHVVYTRTGTTGTLYVDGISEGTHTGNDVFTSTDFWSLGQIWSVGPVAGYFFQGSIDETRVYNRPLSQTDVRVLYNTGLIKINSSIAQRNIVTSGLIGYWTLDGENMTSTLAYDSSSSGNTLSTLNGPRKTLGKVGQAINMDAVDDQLLCTEANCGGTSGGKYDMGTRDWTAMAWIKPEAGGTNCNARGSIVSKIGDDENGWYLAIGGQYICAEIRGAVIVTSTLDGLQVPLNEWSHVAVVFDRDGNMTRYLNGVQTGTQDSIATNDGSTVDHPHNFCIGARDGGTGCDERLFDGSIDEVRIYERVVTIGEIKQIYNAGVGTKINSSQNVAQGSSLNSGLIGQWSFNGLDLTDRVYDRSGSANHGYITGAATSTVKSTGKSGQGLNFDGTGDSVYLGDPSSIRPSNLTYITMSGWMNTNVFGNSSYLIAKDDGTGTDATALAFRFNAEARCGIGGTYVTTTGLNLQIGTWYNLTCTYDGANVILYVNGVSVLSTAKTGAIADVSGIPWQIGGRGLPVGDVLNGKLDEVRMYDRALSASEVKQLYLINR